jgi:hypothetical protein
MEPITGPLKTYKVGHRNKHYKFEGASYIKVQAPNKGYIRRNWWSIINTDQEVIVSIEEVI